MAAFQPKKILFIRWKCIGDVVQTLPAWSVLRSAFPAAHMTFMTSAEHQGLVNMFPGVDAVLAVDRHGLFSLSPSRLFKSWRTLWRSSVGASFDLVVDMQGYGETALITWLSRAKQRWGTLYKPSRKYAYTAAVPRNDSGHAADAFLEVLTCNGLTVTPAACLQVPQADVENAKKLLTSLGIKSGAPLAYLHPLTSGAHKNWPLDRFAQLAKHIQDSGWQVVIGGGPQDRERLRNSPLANFPLARGQSMSTSIGLVSLAQLVIGGDTGLIHVAQAAGTRVLALLREPTLERFHPYQHPDWAIGQGEIAELPVDKVIRAFDQASAELVPVAGRQS